MGDIDPEKFGAVQASLEACKDSIERTESLIVTHLKNYREDIINLHTKNDDTIHRIDGVKEEVAGVKKDFTGFKGRTMGFLAAIGAVWSLFLKWVWE